MRHRFRKGGVVLAGVLAIAFAIGTFLHMGPAEAAKPRPDGKIPYFAPKETITSGTFEVFLKEEGTWRKVASLPFDLAFREKAVQLGKVARSSGGVTFRLLKKGGGPAHIDAIFLSGKPPRLISGTSETQGPMLVSRRDFDVIDASEGTLEFTFPAPAGDAVLTLIARIQGEKISTTPFRFPLSNLFKPMTAASHFYSYRWKEGAAAFGPGGKALERTPQLFREFCRTGTGHPSGFAYGWVGNDGKNLYVRIDFTGDNTRDGDKDYAKVYVNTPQGLKEFKVSEAETRWGKTSFTYTDKVSYRHKVYDFAIPADEIGLPPDRTGGTLSLAFAAYGTEAASLSVVSTNPESNATNVPVDNLVSGTFDTTLNPATVDNGSFTLVRTSDSAPVTGTAAASGVTATFTPSASLSSNTQYTATMTTVIRGAGGEFMSSDYAWSFTTAGADNSVTLFFRDTPSNFGCAVARTEGTLSYAGGAVGPLLVPAIMILAGRARRRWGRGGKKSIYIIAALLVPVFLAGGSRVATAGPLGPPQPDAAKGRFSLGAGYFHVEEKWEPDQASVSSGGVRVEWATERVNQNTVFLKGAYGLSPFCQVDVAVGAADRGAPQGFEDSFSLFGGVGAKGIIYSTPRFAVGPIVQAKVFSDYEDDISFTQAGSTWRGRMKVESVWEVTAGIGIQTGIGKALVYGGPLFHWTNADVNYRITNGTQSLDVSTEYSTKNPFGGFAGVRAALPAGLSLEIEGQVRDRFSVGGTVSYPF